VYSATTAAFPAGSGDGVAMTVLVAYSSKHGSTEEIAGFIAERLRQGGVDAKASPVKAVSDIDGVDALVIGSAIYVGSWMEDAMDFVERHAPTLASRPVWLFSVGPLGTEVADDEEQPKQIHELRETLRPRDHRVFFGALDRAKLGFGERMMVKAVKAPEGDFRDWDDIGAWTDAIARVLRAG
jgi:menaquinone-dependent protoporphyrinogen oxidase